jgi:hypothetical protein
MPIIVPGHVCGVEMSILDTQGVAAFR